MTNDSEHRTTEQGDSISVGLLRDYLTAALRHDAAIDPVNELLHDHVAKGRFHPSVIAAALKPIINDLINTATGEDWQAVADTLISDARATLAV